MLAPGVPPEPSPPKPAPLLPVLLCSGVLAGWCMVIGDSAVRVGWPYIDATRHTICALALYAAIGTLLGLLVSGLVALEQAAVGRSGQGEDRRWLSPYAYGVVGALASINTALWTFSGEQVSRTALGTWGPVAFILIAGFAAACGSALILWALAGLWRGNHRPWLVAATLFLCGGAIVMYVDLTAFVALYSRVHTLLELVAALSLGAAFALMLAALCSRSAIAGIGVRLCGAGALLWLGLALVVPQCRTWFDSALRHVWLEEVYLGRMLRRVQIAEAFFRDPLNWPGLEMSRIRRLQQRYPLAHQGQSDVWAEPLDEPEDVKEDLELLRGPERRRNIIVYYVDTLRHDVAADEKTMPNAVRFGKRAVTFARAYSTGSDTLRSLPALTGGNYDVMSTPPNDILRVARRNRYESTLIIAKSAHVFLNRLRPEFRFDSTIAVADYPEEQEVWGYGAQRPTAARIVDRALEYLDAPRPKKTPFLLWLFNFDVHNWRELETSYVEEAQRRFGIEDDPALLPYRYRAVAAATDAAFGKLVEGLERRKLLEDTVVLFVSDHGEALGRDGFWVHSVFLWEPLIRVPLILSAPGLEPTVVEDKVSIVDVAPTLARYMERDPDTTGYQGEDLLSFLLPGPSRRRNPLLLLGASKDVLVRVGLIDPVNDWKLVLSLEAALPELYELAAPDPDAVNLADAHPSTTIEALEQLVSSPVFPRSADDFAVRDTREQKAEARKVEAPMSEATPENAL